MSLQRPDRPADRAAELLATRAAFGRVEAAILARTPEHDLTPSLERIAALMDLLGSAQRSFGVVHVTGTNGKTSTTRMIEMLLRAHGLNTGRFTSPHLHSITERIALNGDPVGMDRFVAGYEDIRPYVELVDERSAAAGGPTMSYFEVLTALAYALFADAPVDVAAVEVGMGGAWDATNVADGQVAVIAPIGVDHQRFLGHLPVDIATEKAGIIKPGAIVISAAQHPEVAEVIADAAERLGAALAVEGRDIGVSSREPGVGGQLLSLRGLAGEYSGVLLPLFGAHQAGNALLALTAVEAFLGGGKTALDLDLVREAFAEVTSPGRLEVVRRSPTVLVDAAHNPAGAAALAAALAESFPFLRIVGVVAVLADKDATGILEALEPVLARVVVSRSTSPRAMDPATLGGLAGDLFGESRVSVVADLPDAVDRAVELADADSAAGGVGGIVVATGSVTTAADVRMLLGALDQ
ncbi:MAG TPA: folylpolyglutamate synthase/dihydrofolate synthase family protein [Dermatophilaceae bacterium]|nr:folylpolyglutamate synthase/dihydrofolate synthase family protein [Dermatophilaceae bacterium]